MRNEFKGVCVEEARDEAMFLGSPPVRAAKAARMAAVGALQAFPFSTRSSVSKTGPLKGAACRFMLRVLQPRDSRGRSE